MKKFIFILIIVFLSTFARAENIQKVYFAGGCFWCMEESFDKISGVKKTTSGYSGGHVKNPTYEQVVSENTGHLEVVEIVYDSDIISYPAIMDIFFKNIDPFDAAGQFCDKGESYRSAIFYQNETQKKIAEQSIEQIEKKFNKKTFVLLKPFQEFYKAEEYHQDYYQNNFLRYLAYKKACQREEILSKIWQK